jgi:hypothetical protein
MKYLCFVHAEESSLASNPDSELAALDEECE